MSTITEQVLASADDGQESSDTTWSSQPGSGYMRAGRISAINRNIGMRFTTVAIPQGATINTATLTVDIAGVSGSPTITLYGDDVDDAAAWGSSSRPSQITQTTANKAWSAFAPGTGLEVVDVKTIVQELVDRAGWATGNDMRFGWLHPPGTTEQGIYVFQRGTSYMPTNPVQLDVDYTVGGTAYGLAVADITQGQALDAVALTQANALVVADVAQSQALDAVALTQQNALAVAEVAQAQGLDAVSLTQANSLVLADIAQAQSLGAVSLTQQNSLAVDDAVQSQALDEVALTQANVLEIADLAQAHELDAVALTQANALVVADALQAQGLEGVVLVQQNTLAVADLQQDQVLDAVVLSISALLQVADSLQSQSLETVALIQGYVLAVQDALQAQALDGVSLNQSHLLVVADLLQGQSLAGVGLLLPSLQHPFETETADARSREHDAEARALTHAAGASSHTWTAPRRQN